MVTSDKIIRNALHRIIIAQHSQDRDTLIVHELRVCQGEARIDIALLNGTINGYEIKSDHDDLSRLPAQIEVYRRVFDTITVVSGLTHAAAVEACVPTWCGVYVARCSEDGSVSIEEVRRPAENPAIDPFSLAQFLWRDELLTLLATYDLGKEAKKWPRFKLWRYVANSIPLDVLKAYVRDCLKKRQTWPSRALRMSGGGSY
ncbi:MAG: sce7726 family protein [Bacillota bacterium]